MKISFSPLEAYTKGDLLTDDIYFRLSSISFYILYITIFPYISIFVIISLYNIYIYIYIRIGSFSVDVNYF